MKTRLSPGSTGNQSHTNINEKASEPGLDEGSDEAQHAFTHVFRRVFRRACKLDLLRPGRTCSSMGMSRGAATPLVSPGIGTHSCPQWSSHLARPALHHQLLVRRKSPPRLRSWLRTTLRLAAVVQSMSRTACLFDVVVAVAWNDRAYIWERGSGRLLQTIGKLLHRYVYWVLRIHNRLCAALPLSALVARIPSAFGPSALFSQSARWKSGPRCIRCPWIAPHQQPVCVRNSWSMQSDSAQGTLSGIGSSSCNTEYMLATKSTTSVCEHVMVRLVDVFSHVAGPARSVRVRSIVSGAAAYSVSRR